MRLLRTKIWSWADIWMLKWCAFLFGMIGGAYLSDMVKQYVWVLLVLAIAVGIKPAFKYFGNSD